MARFLITLLLVFPLLQSQPGASIDESEAVEIGGIKQWISIKATDRNNPVLLFLHGGPGNSVMGYADKFTGELQKHFVVVQWDQRESGMTAKLNSSDLPLSVALMEEDAITMINYLRSRFDKKKVYLMGHSWGGFLGLSVAASHPELLNAYMAVCPMVHQVESERFSLGWMLERAKDDNNQKAIAELTAIHIPFQNGTELFYHRSWLATMMGNKVPTREFVESWAEKWLPLFNEASAVNFFQVAPEIHCPIYFFVGTKDYTTYFKLTEDYYNGLKATKKRIFSFENTGHGLPAAEPEKMQRIVVDEILPLQGR